MEQEKQRNLRARDLVLKLLVQLLPLTQLVVDQPQGLKQLSVLHELNAQNLNSPETKVTTPKEKDMPDAFSHVCSSLS